MAAHEVATMLGVTVFGLVFTPVFHVVIRRLTARGHRVQARTVAA